MLLRGKSAAIPFNLILGDSGPDSIVESVVIVNGVDDRSIATSNQVDGDVVTVLYVVPASAQDGDDHNVRLVINEGGEQISTTKDAGSVGQDIAARLDQLTLQVGQIAPVAPDIPLESSNVRQGVVFGKVGDEQVGTFSPVCDVAGSGNVVDAVLKPAFEAVLIEARVCSYTNRLLLDAMYGRQNIDEWANLENCEDDAQSKREITARIQLEINRVESYLDDSLRHLYCTPFECPVPPTIEAIATALVGHNLRDARYMNEEDTVVLRKYERAMNTLHQLKEGSIRVPGFMVKAHPQFE